MLINNVAASWVVGTEPGLYVSSDTAVNRGNFWLLTYVNKQPKQTSTKPPKCSFSDCKNGGRGYAKEKRFFLAKIPTGRKFKKFPSFMHFILCNKHIQFSVY